MDHRPSAAPASSSAAEAAPDPAPFTGRRAALFALAFASGFAVLTIEIVGARLIAPVFGLSAIPWTAVIGVVLGALAVGNHLGGRLADAGRVSLSRILVLAGMTGALPVIGAGVPWVARSVFGFIPGAVVSALVLFAPSVLCLGAVVPYLVRADTESLDRIGRRAGDISAVATAGSILGSFTTGFLLLPAMPLPVLLGATAGALFVMAWAAHRVLGPEGRGPEGRPPAPAGDGSPSTHGSSSTGAGQAPAADGSSSTGGPSTGALLLGVVALPTLGVLASGSPPDTLHAEQTLYTAVAVTERPWADGRLVRELWQNGGSSSAEYVDSGEPAHVYARESLALLEPLVGEMERALVLGGAALTLPVALQELAAEAHGSGGGTPALEVDVVEIDPAVTRLAERYFVYGQRPRPGIDVIHEDARVFLRQDTTAYDLVYLDVFDHLLTVPWTMVTQEAVADMARRLDDDGVFMANVLSPLAGEGTAFLRHFKATLDAVFPVVHLVIADPTLDAGATQNVLVVAGSASAVPEPARPVATVDADVPPLTDTWAPVEYLQAKVFLEGLRWR